MINEQINKNINKKIACLKVETDLHIFYNKFKICSTYIKILILDFCDIFSVGKLGLVNKFMNNFIYKNYHLEKISNNYCIAIFKNSNLYINQKDKIIKEYNNYLNMLKKRPRIFYSGVYYSRIKFTKVGETFGQQDISV